VDSQNVAAHTEVVKGLVSLTKYKNDSEEQCCAFRLIDEVSTKLDQSKCSPTKRVKVNLPHVCSIYNGKVNQSHYRPGVPRGFQEVKVPRFRDNGTGWW